MLEYLLAIAFVLICLAIVLHETSDSFLATQGE